MTAKTLGERIRELRGERDISLREMGKRLGKGSAAFLSDVELGRRYPSDELLIEIARVLKTSIGDLKSHDTRLPIRELKRLARHNPTYGLALRKIIDKGISAEELMKFAVKKRN